MHVGVLAIASSPCRLGAVAGRCLSAFSSCGAFSSRLHRDSSGRLLVVLLTASVTSLPATPSVPLASLQATRRPHTLHRSRDMTIMDGDDMQRLWSLIEDLTNQLQANRQLCESLQQQADQLRGQAIHSGTGFALRRFNTDISKEKFESELESLNVHLVKENLALSHENKQQAVLLREYENTLETVMAKFRSFSHSTQQHTLQLTQHYESLLAQTTHNAAQQTLAAETAFSGTLTHLGGLVRRAMQSLDGEFSDEDDQVEDHDGTHDAQPRKPKRGWTQDPKWYGSGGYTGKITDPAALRADEALEHLTEEERLRMENETFRELLGLKEKSDALLSAAPVAEAHAVLQPSKPLSPAERRASLTVDEAAIAAEASGQPSSNALQVSSTLRPDDMPTSAAATIPSATRSPKLTPTLERKEQIIEEAIMADDEQDTERGRRAGDASPVINADSTAFERVPAAPASTSADDAESAPSSLQELRAAAAQSQAATERPSESTVAAGADADAITPIDEVDAIRAAEPATSDGPNLVAEAAPPALVSTGMEDADATSKTTVTSVSGAQPGDAVTDSTTSSSSISPKSEPSSLTALSETASTEASSPAVSDDAALPKQDSELLDKPASSAIAAEPTVAASQADSSEAAMPAEPSKQDEESAKEEAAQVAAGARTVAGDASSGTVGADAANSDTKSEGADVEKDAAAAAKNVPTPKEQPGQGKKADGSASPSKRGGRHRGKGRHHNKSHSSASNKGS